MSLRYFLFLKNKFLKNCNILKLNMLLWIIFLLAYFFYSFNQLKKIKGIKNLCFILFFSFFILGGLNKQHYSFIFELSDWIILVTLLTLILFGLINKREYLVKFSRIEILLIIYFIFQVFIPLVYHLSNEISSGDVFKYLIPIRIYFVYKIFFFLFSELNVRAIKNERLLWLIPIILKVGAISAIISLIKFLPYNIPLISNALDIAWPLPALKWYRLWGTNGGTNSAGNLFALLTIISIYYNVKIKKTSIGLVYTGLFIICLLLSGSLSSIGGFGIVLFMTSIMIKEFRILKLKQLLFPLIIFIVSIFYSETIKESLLLRIQKQFRVYGEIRFIPFSLEDRLKWWGKQIEEISDKNKMMFGYGPGGMEKQHDPINRIDTGAESFYLKLLQFYGLPSIIYFLAFCTYLLYLIKNKCYYDKHNQILFPIIMFYPIAGIANETLHYGAMTEIFGFTLSQLSISSFHD